MAVRLGLSRLGEEEVKDRVGVGGFVGDEEPSAPFALVREVRENGDAAGAGAGGEIRRVVVEGAEKRYDWSVNCAFWRLVYLC